MANMPTTHRPFFGSFLSAFRAQGASLQKVAAASPTAATSATQATAYSTQSSNTASNASNNANGLPTASQARTIGSKSATTAGATSVAIQASHFQTTRQYHHSTSPYSPTSTSPGNGALTPLHSRGRRGSDSSSEGFRETSAGAEKLYIGGRTATGEERVYKLSMVKRPRSIDRISLDRMSL